MSLANWFRNAIAPRSSPRIDALIAKAIQYLKSRPAGDDVLPRIVGKAIGESELTATTALRMLEERGVTHHHFGVYCGKTHAPLDSKDDLTSIEPSHYCEICDEEHSHADDTCKVEVYYSVDPEELGRFAKTISAA